MFYLEPRKVRLQIAVVAVVPPSQSLKLKIAQISKVSRENNQTINNNHEMKHTLSIEYKNRSTINYPMRQ